VISYVLDLHGKVYEYGCIIGVAPRSLVDTDRLIHQCSDDGGNKHLRNIGQYLPDYKAQNPRRQPSSMCVLFPEYPTSLFPGWKVYLG
jgi:hypothetical protein